jgi:hypothetical protein
VQEWNVSREESKDLVKRGVVISDGEEDAEVIAIELNKNPSCKRVDGETEVSVTDIPNFESLLVPPSLLFPCFQWKMHSRTLEALCANTYIQVNEGAFLIILTMRSAR